MDVSFCFVLIVCKQDHTLDKKLSHYLSFLIHPMKGIHMGCYLGKMSAATDADRCGLVEHEGLEPSIIRL